MYKYLILLLLLSCKKERAHTSKEAISNNVLTIEVSGEIPNHLFLLKDNALVDTIPSIKDGIYKDTLQLESGVYRITDGNNFIPVYFYEGTEVKVNYNSQNLVSTLKFSKDNVLENEFLWNKIQLIKKNLGDGIEMYELKPDDFKLQMQAWKDSLFAELDNRAFNKDFSEFQRKSILYDYYSDLIKYEGGHRYVSKNQNYINPEGFLDEVNDLNYSNGNDYLLFPKYKQMVYSKLTMEFMDLAEKDNTVEPYFIFIDNLHKIKNDTIRNDFLFQNTMDALSFSSNVESVYNSFIEHSTNEQHRMKVATVFDNMKKLLPGNPSPIFVKYRNYDGSKTSLSDLKGKYVYIDIWATWCRPCLNELPYLKELEHKLGDKNIAFVSISVDLEKEFSKWKEIIKEKGMGGIQLFADNANKSKFFTDYMIKGIPRFILLDPEGIIIDSNAPRPSDPKTEKLLNSLEFI